MNFGNLLAVVVVALFPLPVTASDQVAEGAPLAKDVKLSKKADDTKANNRRHKESRVIVLEAPAKEAVRNDKQVVQLK